MRLRLAIFLAAAVTGGAAQAAPPARLIEASAEPTFDRNAVTQIVADAETRRTDPAFNIMASHLGDALMQAGLNIRQDAADPDVYILFEYKAVSIPLFRRFSSINDSAYRAVVVTAIAARPWRESHAVNVLWQTAFDQPGVSSNPDKVIPPLLKAGVPWYGRNLTRKGLGPAARCAADTVGTGSHIAGACTNRDSPAAAIAAVFGSVAAGP